MEHRHIDEHNLVERYVLGQLDEDEQSSFEDHFAECPRCLEAVELAQEIRAGLAEVSSPAARTPAEVVPIRPPRPRTVPRRAGWTISRWAAAAVLALALLPSLWLARRNRELASDLESLRRPWAATPAAVLELRRDATAPDAVAAVPAPDGPWIPLAVDLGGVAGLGADVRLYRGDGRLLWTGEGLPLPDSGPLTLSFPSLLLTPGRYRIEVSLKSGDRVEPAGAFWFEIVP